jgi:hypothetical protein
MRLNPTNKLSPFAVPPAINGANSAACMDVGQLNGSTCKHITPRYLGEKEMQ